MTEANSVSSFIHLAFLRLGKSWKSAMLVLLKNKHIGTVKRPTWGMSTRYTIVRYKLTLIIQYSGTPPPGIHVSYSYACQEEGMW